MFDLDRLRLLRELAHRGTMTAVASACGLTSSAVSQQLATLEREAGAKLFERIGRRVRLTDEGLRLTGHAEEIMGAVEAAKQDLEAGRGTARGTLEIACFPSFAKAHLLPAVIRARKRSPELSVLLHDLEPADSIEAVRTGRCQVAVSFAYSLVPRPDVPGLTVHPLLQERVLLALPARWRRAPDPIPLKGLAGEDWIVGSRGADDLALAERACAVAGFAPRIAHTVDDYDLVLQMVAAGLGIGFVPELGLNFPSAKRVVLRHAAGHPLHRRIYALTRDSRAGSPLVQALIKELVRAESRKQMA
ncbi:MAG TPA: LysR family transcriptional regulator [Candidatus Cybelea sp.]|nr:LysR family transcriptional regulator [Candidatus Cybelea sp.]